MSSSSPALRLAVEDGVVVMLTERVEVEGVRVVQLEAAVLFQVGELALERPVHVLALVSLP